MAKLGIFGQTEEEQAVEETVKSSMRAELLKKAVLGGSWSVGAAIVFAAFEFLKSDPHDAFPLLRSWGPWAIFGMLVVWVLYDLARMVLNIGIRLTHAIERLATAQQKSADKDDRQMQEMQTLTAYTAQQSEKMHEKLSKILEKVEELGEAKRT